jgi:iron complex transport system ATP-binding protein
MLEVKAVHCGYGKQVVLKDISFTLAAGELLCLLGPNGVGKTTLFKTILGAIKPLSGQILLDGREISRLNRRHFARLVGYVPQAHVPPFPFRVIDVVTMGRTAHFCVFSTPTAHDVDVAGQMLRAMNIEHLRDKVYTEISGGERQLVLIARALAQQPKVLIMDEPTSNLDFGHQLMVLDHIRAVALAQKAGVILTTHSPNHALAYASTVAILGRDGGFSIGRPDEVISEAYLQQTYSVEAELLDIHTRSGRQVTLCVPLVSA